MPCTSDERLKSKYMMLNDRICHSYNSFTVLNSVQYHLVQPGRHWLSISPRVVLRTTAEVSQFVVPRTFVFLVLIGWIPLWPNPAKSHGGQSICPPRPIHLPSNWLSSYARTGRTKWCFLHRVWCAVLRNSLTRETTDNTKQLIIPLSRQSHLTVCGSIYCTITLYSGIAAELPAPSQASRMGLGSTRLVFNENPECFPWG